MDASTLQPRTYNFRASVQRAVNPARVSPGFAARNLERAQPVNLPAWFIDRCRRAYLSIDYPSSDSRIIGVTSALYGEGKTSIAAGIAMAIAADTTEPTLLVECDFEHASFDRLFGINTSPGLADWLQEREELRVLRASPLENLCVLPAGGTPQDPARLIYQLSQSGLIDELKPDFPNIVIDLPPMLNIAYSSLASKLAERMVLVAKYGVTPIDDIEKAVFLLGREKLSGIVLNGYSSRLPRWMRRAF